MEKKKIRVLHISKYFYPHDGGIETVCRDIMFALKKRSNIQQLCLCFGDEKKADSIQYVLGFPVLRISPIATIKKQGLSIKYFFVLKQLINRFHPDVIHVHLPNLLVCFYLLLISKKFRIILHWHSDIIDQRFLYFIFRSIEQRCLSRADLILATTKKYIDGSYALEKWRFKCKVCPNIVDIEKYEICSADISLIAEVKKKYGQPIVFFIGRHVKYKGLELLIAAAKIVQTPCHFVIAGTGPLSEKLKAQKCDNVSFIGRISDDELRLYYHAAKIFVFPSITKNEAFGISLAEALSCGLPAVTFTIPGSGVNVVSIGGKTGIEVSQKTPEALAKGIDLLLTNKSMYCEFSKNAAKHIRDNFSRSVLEKIMTEIY